MDKKEKILNAALELFASDGYHAVSTSKIAKVAQVSEGLIFRHYKNKQGLLDAILKLAFERAVLAYAPIIVEQNPKEALRKAILIIFDQDEEKHHFWKLQFKLKWELELSGKDKSQPLVDKLAWAFKTLGHKNPKEEAELLQHTLENILGVILREGIGAQDHLKAFLLDKYGV